MKLSVIIVNYNVRLFLEQSLRSVIKASENHETEIIVVDNNSADGSVQMVHENFPQVICVANEKNMGFSAANNQGIQLAQGEFILLLNPDTVVEEDSFNKTIHYLETHIDVGGLGVKMIDGKGNFLPESKRGLPTPAVAFYKIFGLSKLCPKSKRFNYYHLGHLPVDKTNEVEVLSGAFMMIRSSVLKVVGLLDDTFFMYGEDIDLSYRITQAGYKNIYFPETTIIHYKGESTKKGSLNYVLIFYRAMQIFAQKHFTKKRASLFNFLINLAIYFRASLAILYRIFKTIFFPLIDSAIIYSGYLFMAPRWGNLHGSTYPKELFLWLIPVYIVIWLLSVFMSGGYDKSVKIWDLIKGVIIGTALILILYSLLSEDFRFSRMLIFLGTLWTLLLLTAIRFVYQGLKLFGFRFFRHNQTRIAIVGQLEKVQQIETFVSNLNSKTNIIGYILHDRVHKGTKVLGSISQLEEIIKINKINELIFSASSLPAAEIIRHMVMVAKLNVIFKIASPDGLAVIGSNSVETNGEIYMVSVNSVLSHKNRRIKRLFDIITSTLLLLLFPLYVLFIKNGSIFFNNIWIVFIGKKSWIGYSSDESNMQSVKFLKNGIFPPFDVELKKEIDMATQEKIYITYAQQYSLLKDLSLFFGNIKYLNK